MSDLMTRQAELEYECVLLGQKRYFENRASAGESETRPGREQTKRALPALTRAIEEFIEQAAKPNVAGRKHIAVRYLAYILPEQAAYLTIRTAMDAAASDKKLQTAAIAVASAIEDHINLVKLNEQAPGLYRKVMEQVRHATEARHRRGVLRHVVSRYAIDKLSWSQTDKLHLGVKLIELFDSACGLVRPCRNTTGHHKTPVKLVFTEEAQRWFDEAHDKASTWLPVHLPMLVPPKDWVSPTSGGYLTKALRLAVLVQGHHRAPAEVSSQPEDTLQGAAGVTRRAYLDTLMDLTRQGKMDAVYAAVNAVQRTPWRVNRALLSVMKEARSGGDRLQALFVDSDRPLPPRPTGIDPKTPAKDLSPGQREELSVWKREAAEVYDYNARLRSKRVSVARKLWVADRFVDDVAIYFPHYVDFRGRLYPFAHYLNPQSDDPGRALLEFAEGRPLGARGLFWLKVHIANLFGVDKVSFEERVKWVNEHMEELHDSAACPLDGRMFWTEADSPWCALAAIFELAGASVVGVDYVSHLPIAMDGSCSGLQHYSAMLRDPVGGAAVNLVPADKPGDIYTQVAKRAQALSDSSTSGMADTWRGKVVRKIAKQPTMTMCYSATVFGMQGQIAKAVEGLGGSDYLGGADVRPACIHMAHTVWEAIGDTVVAAKNAMAFLKEIAALATEAGTDIRWTSPAGFPVWQGYRMAANVEVDLHYRGVRLQLRLVEEEDRLNRKKQTAGIAPNFVHSLDSAHLMATVNLGEANGLNHWACIHDSFGVHAADVDVLHACIREAFIEQYTPSVLTRFRDEVVARLPAELAEKAPEVPPQGTLDLAAVREARYFFA